MTKGKPPRLPFRHIKDAILGEQFEVSLVFIGDKRSKTLNKAHRNKNCIANVLTFPLDKHEGEIFVNLKAASRDAKHFNASYTSFVGLLFIHALLHLKGIRHGSRMETVEEEWRKKFNI